VRPQVAFQPLVNAPAKVLQAMLADGVRPQFPAHAPAWLTSLAARCWHTNPSSRPKFRRIVAVLQAVQA
jgi:hypothetical protein